MNSLFPYFYQSELVWSFYCIFLLDLQDTRSENIVVLIFHCDTRSTMQRSRCDFFMIGCGYCKGSTRKKYGLKNEGCADLSSSVLGWLPCEFAQCVVAWLLLSIPRLFYAQLPSSSSTSPPGLISSSVSSPKNQKKVYQQDNNQMARIKHAFMPPNLALQMKINIFR